MGDFGASQWSTYRSTKLAPRYQLTVQALRYYGTHSPWTAQKTITAADVQPLSLCPDNMLTSQGQQAMLSSDHIMTVLAVGKVQQQT